MLIETMKKKFNKWFVVAVVGGMSLVFIFVGVFPTATKLITGGNDIATVGGEPISVTDFQRTLSREMESYKMFGDQLPPFFLAQIQERALQTMVQQKLLSMEAKRMGVVVSTQEVMKEIQKLPYFQNEQTKQFDVAKYKDILTANRLTPGAFEAMVQEDLVRSKLVQFFQSRIRITEDEVKREYEIAGSKRNLEYVRIRNEDAFAKMQVSSEEIQKFLTDPTKKKLLEGHYNTNISKYRKSDEVCARHILKRVAPAKAEEKTDAGTPPPAEFVKLHPTKANFADLAKKSSDDPGTKVKGGDLGCFGKGMMDEAFEKAAFTAPVGTITAPVKSAFGWHYIYVYDKKAGFEKKLESVEKELAEELLKKERLTEVQKINRASAEEIKKRWASGDKKSFKFTETGLFTRVQSSIPTIGRSDEILRAAFSDSAPLQKEPQVFEAAGGVIIARVKEKVEPDMAKFEGEKEKQFKTLQTRKLESFFPAWMENVQASYPVKFNTALLERVMGQLAGGVK